MKSQDIFSQNVRVAADVKIVPNASVGDIEAYCVGDPVLESCSNSDSCAYMVNQLVCVRFPLRINIDVDASAGILCGVPERKHCHCGSPSCERCHEMLRQTQRDECSRNTLSNTTCKERYDKRICKRKRRCCKTNS